MNNFNLYLDNLVDQGYDISLTKYYFFIFVCSYGNDHENQYGYIHGHGCAFSHGYGEINGYGLGYGYGHTREDLYGFDLYLYEQS